MMSTTPMSPEQPRDPFCTTTNKLPKIYTANHATFTILVHSRYTRMTGFGRREIEYMKALFIYNKYIECYSVAQSESKKSIFFKHLVLFSVIYTPKMKMKLSEMV